MRPDVLLGLSPINIDHVGLISHAMDQKESINPKMKYETICSCRSGIKLG